MAVIAVCLTGVLLLWTWRAKLVLPNKTADNSGQVADVSVPSIINGNLVLPKVVTGGGLTIQGESNLGKQVKLGVVSASLVPIFDPSAISGQARLSGLRVLGEVSNMGTQAVTGISPVIRFLDTDGAVMASKIARYSSGWDFFGVLPNEKTYYDVTVDNPPQAEKLEIILNAASASDSALFDELKIASRSMEIKTANYQGEASEAGAQKVEYYSVSGQVVNTMPDPVSDIAIYTWVKDGEGRVYAFARQDFKNDLLASGEKIDFKLTLLPLKTGETYDSYELAAWGKRYRLNL